MKSIRIIDTAYPSAQLATFGPQRPHRVKATISASSTPESRSSPMRMSGGCATAKTIPSQFYIQMAAGQHGATHAWTEIYLPGAGWRGFDPANNKLAGSEHVSVPGAPEQQKASPLSGHWEGPSGAFQRMDVSVQVVAWVTRRLATMPPVSSGSTS